MLHFLFPPSDPPHPCPRIEGEDAKPMQRHLLSMERKLAPVPVGSPRYGYRFGSRYIACEDHSGINWLLFLEMDFFHSGNSAVGSA